MRLIVLALTLAWLVAPRAIAAPSLELTPCKVAAETVRCGWLKVPENWRRPGGRSIALKVVVLPKTGPGPEAAPMVWLEGGPGVPGTMSAPLYTADLKFHRAWRAVVLFDMRGTGASGALHCPKTEQHSPLADLWRPDEVIACRRELGARADLSQYSTGAAVDDVEALRTALGAETIDLAALSYGTLLAQAYLERYPDHVRSAALIGTVPLGEKLPLHHADNGERALRLLFADCRADPACRAAFPELAADWARLQARLAAARIVIRTGAGETTLRKGPFDEFVRNQLNTTPSARRLPLLIHRAAHGDFTALVRLVAAQEPLPEADGLYLSVTCPEATLRITPDEIGPATAGTSFGRYRIDQQIAACRLWSPSTAMAAPPTPMRMSTPVLLLAGEADATTPPAWARQVAAGLANSRVVVIPAMSHLPIGLSHMECLDRMMDAFFAKASAVGLDTSCVHGMNPPPFATH